MTTIEVKTQRIVVNPPSGKIDVYGYGPQGPVGPAGPPGSGVVVAWPVVAPPTVDGHIQFTPSNTNIAGLRPSTDANSYMKFGAGPPNYLQFKSNSGPLTSGQMGQIFLDADAVMLRSSDGLQALATFQKSAGVIFPNGVASQLLLRAQDGVNEGGELGFQGAGGYTGSIYIDRYANDLRIVQVGGNIVSFSNGTISAPVINTSGTSTIGGGAGSIVYLGSGSDARVRVGDDTELYDTNLAHTLGLRSTSDNSQGYLRLGTGPRIIGTGGYYQLLSPGEAYYDANTHWIRNAAGGNYGAFHSGGLNLYGTLGLNFSDYGGGWFMQDGTWIRSIGGKSVWLGGGVFGCDGGLTVGTGGGIDGSWPVRFDRNTRVNANLNANSINSGGDIEAVVQVRSLRNSGSSWYWETGIYVTPAAGRSGMGWHPGGVAGSLAMVQNNPTFHFGNTEGTGYWVCWSAGWSVSSSESTKEDVKKLPKFDRKKKDNISDRLSKLDVVSFRRREDQMLSEIPDEEDEKIFIELVKFNRENNLPAPKLPIHVCREEKCGHTPKDPCVWIKNWRRGQIGLIVEDVEKILPEIVDLGIDGEPGGIKLDSLVAILVSAIQELTARVKELEEAA